MYLKVRVILHVHAIDFLLNLAQLYLRISSTKFSSARLGVIILKVCQPAKIPVIQLYVAAATSTRVPVSVLEESSQFYSCSYRVL